MATVVRSKGAVEEAAKMELYSLLAEGLQAIEDGKVSSADEVKEEIARRRRELG